MLGRSLKEVSGGKGMMMGCIEALYYVIHIDKFLSTKFQQLIYLETLPVFFLKTGQKRSS